MRPYFIGVDAGSSVCKAAIFDLDGGQIAAASRKTHISRPHPGWSELNPDEAWRACASVIAELVEKSGLAPETIGGIGLAAAMVGAWVVDEAGEALRPGIIWEDSRAQSFIDRRLPECPDFRSRIFSSSGNVLQQGCTLPVMAWLTEHEPETLARASHVMSYKDYLRLKLTGRVATDRSEASVIPGSAVARDRSDEMIALFGLERHAHLLPPVLDSETIHGGLTASAATALGLPEGLPVAVGAGDVPCTVIGAGALRPGCAVGVLGTTCLVGECHDRPVFEPRDIGLLFTLPGNIWYRAMVNVAGTLNLDWAIATLAPDLAADPQRFAKISALVEPVPVGADGLTYLPYLSESGIIAPAIAPHARAGFAGLSPRHGRAELFRAVFEGVAFAIRDLADLLDIRSDTLLLTGGGTRNALWMRMIADALGKTVEVPGDVEFGARGAALLAATALGFFPDIRAASRAVAAKGARFEPHRNEAVEAALHRYRAHRDRLLRPDD